MPYIHEQEADAQVDDQVVAQPLRRLRHVPGGRLGRRARPAPRHGAGRLLAQARSRTPPTTRSGATRRSTRCSPKQPLTVPVMLVHSLWDQEDIYGATAVYKAIEPQGHRQRQGVPGARPVAPRQEIGDGSCARRRSGSAADTAPQFRQRHPAPVPRPLPEGRRAEGRRRAGHRVRDRHQRLAAAAGLARRVRATAARSSRRRSTSAPGAGVGFAAPRAADAAFDEYVSDPAKPVPFRPRPIEPSASDDADWRQWLVDDQREASGRTDVLTFVSDVADRGRSRSPASRSPTWSPRPAAPTRTGWSS